MSDYEYVPNEDSPTEEPPRAPLGYHLDGSVVMFEDTTTIRTIGGTSEGIAELNRIWAQLVLRDDTIQSLQTEVNNLRFTQINGDDPRLTDFWQTAMELADNANHCEVFDQIAEALGGPSRVKEYSVTVSFNMTVPVTQTVAVEARNEEDACEQALEMVREQNPSEHEDYADWYDAELDRHSMEAEAEEA